MYQGKVELSSKDIYEKEFKIDTRGYRPQEVDNFLDIVIKDYNTMSSCIDELQNYNKNLTDENIALKQQIRNLNMKIEALKDSSDGSSTNVDVLRRLSNLEKIIYGKE